MDAAFTYESESVQLLSQRAAFLPGCSTLLVGDLHLGKGDHLAIHGAPIPLGVNRSILSEAFLRLNLAIDRTGAKRVVVLGDVIHASTGLTHEVVELTCQGFGVCRGRGVDVVFIRGNHDRGLAPLAQKLSVALMNVLVEEQFAFVHDPADAVPGTFTFCGHLHPAVPVGGSAKAPAFWKRHDMCVMPAFSRFTVGKMPNVQYGDELFIVAGEQIVHRRILNQASQAS